MDNIQVAAHDERTLNLAHELPDFCKSLDRILVTDRVGAPETVVVDDGEAVFEVGDLEVEIVRWHATERDVLAIFAVDKLGRSLGERNATENEISESTIAAGEIETPIRRKESVWETAGFLKLG